MRCSRPAKKYIQIILDSFKPVTISSRYIIRTASVYSTGNSIARDLGSEQIGAGFSRVSEVEVLLSGNVQGNDIRLFTVFKLNLRALMWYFTIWLTSQNGVHANATVMKTCEPSIRRTWIHELYCHLPWD
jgi:hypothetical protein